MNELFMDFLGGGGRRAIKPRTCGLTAVCEFGEPVAWTRDMLDLYGDFIDIVEITIGSLVMPQKMIEEKIRLYRDHGLSVVMDDPTFCIAYYSDKVPQFLRRLKDMGFTHCQIETRLHVNDIKEDPAKADEDELRFYSLARELDLGLEGEVGQKYEAGDRARAGKGQLAVDAIIAEMRRLLSLGCERVILESAVIREAIGDYGEREAGTDQVRKIVDAMGMDKIFLEINGGLMPFETRNAQRAWAIRTFGPDINMGGAEPLSDMMWIECIRRGIVFVKGPSKATSRLWVKSLAKGKGVPAKEWWREEYPIDPSVIGR